MDELADSTSLLNDQDELRRRLAGDGYLFFRGLLPAAEVRAVGDAVLDRLRAGGWATTSYQPGDAIIFHCLTPHAALPNRGSALRISGDFRWQRAGQPAPAELVLGPAARPPELFARLFRREPWWEPVPAGLELYPRAHLASPLRPDRGVGGDHLIVVRDRADQVETVRHPPRGVRRRRE